MKRYNNLYSKIYSIENLELADKRARRGKSKQKDIIRHQENREDNIINLHFVLKNKEFKNSKYQIFKLHDPKERTIYKLPYYPDRILHHAIINIIDDILVKSFVSNTYNCIKGRGIHKCLRDLNKTLRKKKPKYCLKLDIKHYYPSINNTILKELLRRKFKDRDLLDLLDEIINSNQGLPIGNYLSQVLGNFYLTYFDHYVKEVLRVENYFRYCDDIVILADSKEELRRILYKIREYLLTHLKLELSNHQIFPVDSRGINFLGYISYETHILLRPSIKHNFIRMIKTNKNEKSLASYKGWIQHCNGKNLWKKYTKEYE